MLGFIMPCSVIVILGDASMSDFEVATRRYFLVFGATMVAARE